MVAPTVLDGLTIRDAFTAGIARMLLPESRPGDVIIMDNRSTHKASAVREAI